MEYDGFEDLLSDFNEFEQKNNLYEIEIDGVFVWNIIRRKVFLDIRNEIFDLNEVTNSRDHNNDNKQQEYFKQMRKMRDKVLSYTKRLNQTVSTVANLPYNSTVIFYNISNRQIGMDKLPEFINRFFADVQNNRNSIILDSCGNMKLSERFIDLGVISKIAKFNQKLLLSTDTNKKRIHQIEEELENQFQVDIDLLSYITKSILDYQSKVRIYDILVSKSNADIVIMRGRPCSLIQACENHGIPTVQITQAPTKSHASFEFGSRNIRYYPDHLFLPGKSWRKKIKYPLNQENVHIVGHPYQEFLRKKRSTANQDKIVVISQPKLRDVFEKCAIKLNNMEGSDIVLKLHPKTSHKEVSPEIINSEIEVALDRNIYDIFSSSSSLVGAYSTAVLEGVDLGLKAILLTGPWVSPMAHHLRDEDYIVCESLENIDSCVRYHRQNNSEANSKLFDSPSSSLIDDSITKIID